jgi:hypothetical protein
MKRSSKKKDSHSPYKISGYFMEAMSEFIAGWLLISFLPFFITFYVGVTNDPTNTVVQSNERTSILLSSFAYALFSVMCLKGSLGQRLNGFTGNTWLSLWSMFIALTDGRIRMKELWFIILPFLYIAFNLAGIFAGAAQWLALFPAIAIPSSYVPILANVVQQSYGWSILIGSVCYLPIFMAFMLTMNGTRTPYSNLWPLTFTTFIAGVVQVVSIKQFPNFAVNLAISYMTGHYELLWVDVVNAFIAMAVAWIAYFFMYSVYFQPDQALQYPNFQIAWDFSVIGGHSAFSKMANIQYRKLKSKKGEDEVSDQPESSSHFTSPHSSYESAFPFYFDDRKLR